MMTQATVKRDAMAVQPMRRTPSISFRLSICPRFNGFCRVPASTTKSTLIRQFQEDDYKFLYCYWDDAFWRSPYPDWRSILEPPSVFYVTSRDIWEDRWRCEDIWRLPTSHILMLLDEGRLYLNNEYTAFLSRSENLTLEHSDQDWILLGRCKDGDFVYIKPNAKISIDPVVKPTTSLLLHQEEDKRISAQFCCLEQSTQKHSAKNLMEGWREHILYKRSKQQILQTTTVSQNPVNGSEDENDGIPIHVDLGRRTIARWKHSGGKGKEWRKRAWGSRSPISQGVPETFLKRFSSSGNAKRHDERKSSKEKLKHSLLNLVTIETLTDLVDVCDQDPYEEDAVWPPERFGMPAHEISGGHASGGFDKYGTSEDQASLELPNETYSGAIIGDFFQLGALIEEHESPGERTYAVNDLRAPELRLVARMYSLAELSGKCRDARKRHIKRLIRRENVCDIRQDGKRFIVYPWNTSPFPLGARQHTAQNQAQQGTRRPESFKGFHNVTEFPSLSSKQPPARSKIFWETSEVRRLFQTPRKQSLPAVGTITPPATLNDPESPVSGPASMPKRKRHRWKKARKKDQLKDYEATEPEELEVLSKTVNPSFSSRTGINKYLELKWESIMDMAAKIDGLDLHEVEMSLWNYFGDPSFQRTVAIEMLAGRERWFIDQLDYVRTVMSIMSQHFHVQDRRKEIDHLAEKEERLRGQQKQIAFSEHKLRVRLMKSKEGKKKERVKDFYEDICRELDNIEVALEDTVQKQEAILAGGDHSCG